MIKDKPPSLIHPSSHETREQNRGDSDGWKLAPRKNAEIGVVFNMLNLQAVSSAMQLSPLELDG